MEVVPWLDFFRLRPSRPLCDIRNPRRYRLQLMALASIDWQDLLDSGKLHVFGLHMALGQNLVALVNIKIAGKWVFTPLTLIIIGFDAHLYVWVNYNDLILTETHGSWLAR